MRILVTGGLGFIGSHFIRQALRRERGIEVRNLDKHTYAANPANLDDVRGDPEVSHRLEERRGDIADEETVADAMKDCDVVVNFAAASHVDRSILDAKPFLQTNVLGVHTLLEEARRRDIERFVQISTDEVYGPLMSGAADEDSPLRPKNPYAATKAAADHLVQAYRSTYGLPTVIVRPCNNYGPYQFPEKLVPLAITNVLDGKKIPVYGKGEQCRQWLFVEDCARAILWLALEGKSGETYNIGSSDAPHRNIDTVNRVMYEMGPAAQVEYVADRLGHDWRYAVDSTKIAKFLMWRPEVLFDEGIRRTVAWYRKNEWWWRPLKERAKL